MVVFPLYVEMFLILLFVPALAGTIIGLIEKRIAKAVSVMLYGISCSVGIMAYAVFYVYGAVGYSSSLPSVFGTYTILMDGLSSIMITVSSIVFLMIILHMMFSRTAPECGKYHSIIGIFFISCVLTMCADNVMLVLLSWEVVTLASFVMSYSSAGEGPRRKFFIITHIGSLLVIAAFLIMFSFASTGTLSSWSGLTVPMGPTLSFVAAAFLFLGFGTKLGLIPFHIWMPDLYAGTSTHTMSLISTVSSNVAVLILFKGLFIYIGITETAYMLAMVMMLIASVSMIWAALESLIQTEPKRILAYSSMENMCLVVLAMALGLLFAAEGLPALATIAIVAGLFHTINHAVSKSLMLLTVGTIEDSTGETNMNRMGGLAKVLPFFSMISLIAVLSMAAIPPFNGFASEWMIIQSFFGGEIMGMRGMSMILPLGVAVLGISGMLVAVSYARMYGFIFLGRPRSESFVRPRKISAATLVPLAFLALVCIVTGVFAGPVMHILADGVSSAATSVPPESYSDTLDTLNIPMLAAILLVLTVSMYMLNKAFKKRTAKSETWGCGGDLEDHMQYSSLGFTQPLVRVFHPLYGDITEISDDAENKIYTVRFKEPFVTHFYRPVVSFVMKVAGSIGRMQNGNIQTYLGYILAVLLVLLMGVRIL
jgi:hydrogenase-4 component B